MNPESKNQTKCSLHRQQKNCIKKSYFCLQECCINQMTFCQECAKTNHIKHKIGRIDQLIPPLSLLNVNSEYLDSKSIHQKLLLNYKGLIEQMHKLEEILHTSIKNIQNFVFNQLKCVIDTFDSIKIQQAKKILENENVEKNKIIQIIHSMNFLESVEFGNYYQTESVCTIMMKKMEIQINKFAEKLDEMISQNWIQMNKIKYSANYEQYQKELSNSTFKNMQIQFQELKNQYPNSME